MSHNTSSVKGLMLYGRWHCWLMWRSRPWWRPLMVYGCGCVVVGKPSCFTTYAEMRFFWLLLSTMNYSAEPFTHIWEWKRCSSSSGSLGSSFWIFVVETVALGSASIIYFPLSFSLSSPNSELEHPSDSKPLAWPPVTTWPDTHLCCEWSSYGTHTTFPCPFLASWHYSLLVAWAGCHGPPRLGFVLCSAIWGHLSLASNSQIQSLASSV